MSSTNDNLREWFQRGVTYFLNGKTIDALEYINRVLVFTQLSHSIEGIEIRRIALTLYLSTRVSAEAAATSRELPTRPANVLSAVTTRACSRCGGWRDAVA